MGLLSLLSPLSAMEKAAAASPKGNLPERVGKSWNLDPFSYMESMMHRDRPSALSYEQLRLMAMKCDVVAAIIQTRVNQVAAFCDPVEDRYGIGYTIVMRDGKAPGTPAAAKMAAQLSNDVRNCGMAPGMARDNFETFLRKFVRDSMTFDQACAEIVPRRNGLPAFFEAVDSATIRYAASPVTSEDKSGKKNPMLDGPSSFRDAMKSYQDDLLVKQGDSWAPAKYVQVINGTVRTSYAEDELYFGVRNPRTDLNLNGYGMSELEMLIGVITSYLYAEEFNRRNFTQGSAPQGILNLKGEITDEQLAIFRREWTSMVSGMNGSWKTPIMNAEDLEYVNLRSTNKDMEYMQWLQFLVRIAAAILLIDPAEINFDMPRGLDNAGNSMFESNNDAKLKASRDRGLTPLLRFTQRAVNDMYVQRIDPDFDFRFVGLGSRTLEQQQQVAVQAVSSYKTLNEVRALEDLPPVPMGDMPMNPTYVGIVQAQQEMAAQQAMIEQQHAHESSMATTKAKSGD